MAKKVKKTFPFLIKGKNLLADLLNVKERRINRAVDAAIDKANEEASFWRLKKGQGDAE